MGKALFLLLQLTVYLDIMLCTSGCVIGDIPNVLGTSMNQSEVVSGFYLNLNSSAQCSGQIVSWSGCYYLEQVYADTRNTHIDLDVGILRPTMDGFILIGNLSKLTIPPFNPSYTFICQTWVLSCKDRLSVEQGDVIGVYLSSTETRFTVLGSVEGASVYQKESLRSESNLLNEFNSVVGYSLYIEATIEQGLGSGVDILCPSVTSTVMTPIPTSTLDSTRSTQSAEVTLPLWAVYVIAIMGSIILVLVVVFPLMLCAKSRLCITAKQRKEWIDIPGEHLPRSSEDNVVPLLHLNEADTEVRATPPIGKAQANATVLSNLNAELQIVVTETDPRGSNGSNLQHNGATSSFNSVQHATPPTAKPRKESLIPSASKCKGGSVQHGMSPIAKPRRGNLNSTASDCSEAGSVQHATPPTVKPRRDIPIAKPRINLNKKATLADSEMLLVDDRKNLRRSKSECELLCQHLPVAIVNMDSEAQRYSELTGSTDSYPYVIRSCEMQSYSISLPDLRNVPLLPPRGASVSSVHGSCESLYAKPDNIGEPQPYLEFQPIYSYAYAKVPLKYRTISASNWSSWNKELPSPHHIPGLPLSVTPRMKNTSKLTNDREVGKRVATSHVQGQRSESDVYMVDRDQLNPLSIDRSKNVHEQVSGVGNQLNSPVYAEIDSPLSGEFRLGSNCFRASPPVGGTANTAEKQKVSNPRPKSPSRIQETTQLNTREQSPKPGKVVKLIGLHNGLHSSKSELPSAGYQAAADSRKMLGSSTKSSDYENDDEFIANSSSDSQHYMNLKEATKNRNSMPYTRSQKVSSSTSETPNHTSISCDDYDHLNKPTS